MAEMTDRDLIGYCAIHCKTERALFIGKHINRMIALAGNPEDFVSKVPADRWFSVYEEMTLLCDLARLRLPPSNDKSREETACQKL